MARSTYHSHSGQRASASQEPRRRVLLFACALLLAGCSTASAGVDQGEVDLTGWSFDSELAALHGEWMAAEGIHPLGRFGDPLPDGAQPLAVRGDWGELVGRHGSATYVLDVVFPEHPAEYGLMLRGAGTSWEMFIDGEPVMAAGVAADTAESSRIDLRPQYTIRTLGGPMRVELRVANWAYQHGGVYHDVVIGSPALVQRRISLHDLLYFFSIGGIVLIGLYQLVVWYSRREESGIFWFAMVCLGAAFVLACSEALPARLLGPDSWEFRLRWGYAAMFLSTSAFVAFVHRSFPTPWTRVLMACAFAMGGAVTLVALLAPIPIVNSSLGVYELWIAVLAVLLLVRTAGIARSRPEGGISFVIGIAVAIVCATHDIAYNAGLSSLGLNLMPVGMFFVSLTLAGAHARKLNRALQTAEHLSTHLGEEVAWRTASLEATSAELEDALEAARENAEAKARFLANMSHELRTPMNGVIGVADLLEDSPLDGEQRELVGTIRSSGTALLSIINDILDVTRIEAGKLTIERIPFSPRGIAFDVARVLAPDADRKGLELAVVASPEVPAVALGDPNRIRQVLMNLTGNAVKFTDMGSVAIRIEPGDGEELRFVVEDTGIGIAAERLAQIFDAFTQAESSTARRFGGTGLGLTICKQLSMLMDGDIEVQSTVGQGSRFVVTLPCPTEEAAAQERPSGIPRPLNVLVADAHPLAREALRVALAKTAMQVVEVASAGDCIGALSDSIATGTPFDVAFVNVDLHIEDEVEWSDGAAEWPNATPLIMVATHAHRAHARVASELGFAATVLKPVHEDSVTRAVISALGLAPPDTGAATSYDGAEVSLLDRCVLVVDDNRVNRRVLERLLRSLGYESVSCEDAESALRMHSEREFDAILMDCHLPGIDGYAATRMIRERERGRGVRTPIIAATASSFDEDREKAEAAGMDDWLPKPIRKQALAATLTRWMVDAPEPRAAQDTPSAQPSASEELWRPASRDTSPESLERYAAFLERVERDVEVVRAAAAVGNANAARRACHALRHACFEAGAMRLGAVALAIERRTAESSLSALVVELCDCAELTVTAIAGWIAALDAARDLA